jgi:hypothetical protein
LRIEPPWPALEPDDGLTFWDIRHGNCHWPLTEVAPISDFRFCALPAMGGSSWCTVHARVAFAQAARPDGRSQRRPRFGPPPGAARTSRPHPLQQPRGGLAVAGHEIVNDLPARSGRDTLTQPGVRDALMTQRS